MITKLEKYRKSNHEKCTHHKPFDFGSTIPSSHASHWKKFRSQVQNANIYPTRCSRVDMYDIITYTNILPAICSSVGCAYMDGGKCGIASRPKHGDGMNPSMYIAIIIQHPRRQTSRCAQHPGKTAYLQSRTLGSMLTVCVAQNECKTLQFIQAHNLYRGDLCVSHLTTMSVFFRRLSVCLCTCYRMYLTNSHMLYTIHSAPALYTRIPITNLAFGGFLLVAATFPLQNCITMTTPHRLFSPYSL